MGVSKITKRWLATGTALFLVCGGLMLGGVRAVSAVSADEFGLNAATQGTYFQSNKQVLGASSVEAVIGKAISVFLGLLGVIFFLLLFYGGAIWMLAMGDSSKVDKSKDILISATIGIILVLSAYAISSFVFELLLAKTPAATTAPAAP